MKIRSTLIVLSLVLGLFSCSYNSGVLKEAQPATQNTSLKSSAVADSGHMTMHFRGINNVKFDRDHRRCNTVFDSAGGLLTKITIVRKGNIREGIKSKRLVIWNTPEHFNDLLYMGKGMMGDLVLLNIPSGVYDYVIVDVSSGWAAKDGKVYPVIFPGHKMILHFRPAVVVGQHLSPDLNINIDVSRSFVPVRGGRVFIFKPFVQAVNSTTTGSLAGAVLDPTMNLIPGTSVYVKANGNTYSTYSFVKPYTDPFGVVHDPGTYWLSGVPAGNYTAYAAKNGYVTDSTQVSIMKGNFTYQNFVLAPE